MKNYFKIVNFWALFLVFSVSFLDLSRADSPNPFQLALLHLDTSARILEIQYQNVVQIQSCLCRELQNNPRYRSDEVPRECSTREIQDQTQILSTRAHDFGKSIESSCSNFLYGQQGLVHDYARMKSKMRIALALTSPARIAPIFIDGAREALASENDYKFTTAISHSMLLTFGQLGEFGLSRSFITAEHPLTATEQAEARQQFDKSSIEICSNYLAEYPLSALVKTQVSRALSLSSAALLTDEKVCRTFFLNLTPPLNLLSAEMKNVINYKSQQYFMRYVRDKRSAWQQMKKNEYLMSINEMSLLALTSTLSGHPASLISGYSKVKAALTLRKEKWNQRLPGIQRYIDKLKQHSREYNTELLPSENSERLNDLMSVISYFPTAFLKNQLVTKYRSSDLGQRAMAMRSWETLEKLIKRTDEWRHFIKFTVVAAPMAACFAATSGVGAALCWGVGAPVIGGLYTFSLFQEYQQQLIQVFSEVSPSDRLTSIEQLNHSADFLEFSILTTPVMFLGLPKTR